jgi:hypothetical protein
MIFSPQDHEKMLRFWAATGLVLGLIAAALFLSSCRQMPVLRGSYQEDQVAQAKVDSRQSDRIADLTDIEDGMGAVLTVIAPEEVKPQVHAIQTKITAVRTQATVQAAQHRERAEQAERTLEATNAAPSLSSWVGAALGGNWMELITMALGALGAGGLAQASRLKSRAQRMAEKAEMLAGMPPEEAKKAAASDPDLCKYRKRAKS